MKDLIDRAAKAISVGASPKDIHDMLIREGLSECDAWLTYVGAEMLAKFLEGEEALTRR